MQAHKDYNPATFEVFIDGGIRRGSDIYKALALGAKAVGVGRPALYAMTAFGADGVQKMIQILKKELQMTMQLMGTPSLAAITPEGVITDDLHRHIATVPQDMLQKGLVSARARFEKTKNSGTLTFGVTFRQRQQKPYVSYSEAYKAGCTLRRFDKEPIALAPYPCMLCQDLDFGLKEAWQAHVDRYSSW